MHVALLTVFDLDRDTLPIDRLPPDQDGIARSRVIAQMTQGERVAATLHGDEPNLRAFFENGEGSHLVERSFDVQDDATHSPGGGRAGDDKCQGGRQPTDTEESSSSQSCSSRDQRNQITAMVAQISNPPPSFITTPAMVWSLTAVRPHSRAASP